MGCEFRSGPGPHDPDAEHLSWTRYEGEINYRALHSFLFAQVPPITAPYIDSPEALQTHCVTKGGIWCVLPCAGLHAGVGPWGLSVGF